MSRTHPKALVTYASCAIGLLYADRLARRGYDLVLLANNPDRPIALARILQAETDVAVEVVAVDLSTDQGLQDVEARFVEEKGFDLVVNNLDLPAGKPLLEDRALNLDRLIGMNVKAYARLAAVAAHGMARRRQGAIINVASAIAFAPEVATGVYGASKSFLVALTRTMQAELTHQNVYVQLVLTGAVRTDVWPFPACVPEAIPGMMTAADLVNAAMVGFDRREAITIPSLVKTGRWASYERARKALLDDLMNSEPAPRYLRQR
ncbi:SDR family NAD(P)-dependent oxidoreductase [Rhizobium sp. 007]|uniref:SDR family NAD(P)-dependent oxidoreductase n=1 Tax=Rhizobium sp. 007 TaxID=2785056 RepID=UPI001890575F|nr:SDR family NAD(P)-dependent oxidoreductase [Rhizobium sp. 007]QPB22806.1 SDR family NAD(P)-dependent oxidoreductase [Rhizobium sp. 007]